MEEMQEELRLEIERSERAGLGAESLGFSKSRARSWEVGELDVLENGVVKFEDATIKQLAGRTSLTATVNLTEIDRE